MSDSQTARTFDVRHLQLARAFFAAVAAVMITFSPDHSAAVGLSVFSGFAIATGLVFFLSAWLVYPAGRRWPSIMLGILTTAAGMISGLQPLRTTEMFFWLVIVWAFAAGLGEFLAGLASRRHADSDVIRGEARDGIVVGAVGLLLGLALLLVPQGFALDYLPANAEQVYTLTGIIIAVGIFGGYAAIVAVYLGIAGFSPQRAVAPSAQANAISEEAA